MATDDPVPAPDNDDWIDFLHWAADGEFLDDAHGIVRVVEKPGSYGDLYAEYLAAGGTERQVGTALPLAVEAFANRITVCVEREVRAWLVGHALHVTAGNAELNLSDAIERGVESALGTSGFGPTVTADGLAGREPVVPAAGTPSGASGGRDPVPAVQEDEPATDAEAVPGLRVATAVLRGLVQDARDGYSDTITGIFAALGLGVAWAKVDDSRLIAYCGGRGSEPPPPVATDLVATFGGRVDVAVTRNAHPTDTYWTWTWDARED